MKLNEQIKQLKKQLADKERIIEELEKQAFYKVERNYPNKDLEVYYKDEYNKLLGENERLKIEIGNMGLTIKFLINPKILEQDIENNNEQNKLI